MAGTRSAVIIQLLVLLFCYVWCLNIIKLIFEVRARCILGSEYLESRFAFTFAATCAFAWWISTSESSSSNCQVCMKGGSLRSVLLRRVYWDHFFKTLRQILEMILVVDSSDFGIFLVCEAASNHTSIYKLRMIFKRASSPIRDRYSFSISHPFARIQITYARASWGWSVACNLFCATSKLKTAFLMWSSLMSRLFTCSV